MKPAISDSPAPLSRGLVLIKWWLLAIPHYLIIAVVGCVAGLVVLAAGVVLLFTGRYPPALFEVIMAGNRWVQRVTAYAALMTDEYPPFRLDFGGSEPGLCTHAPDALGRESATGLS